MKKLLLMVIVLGTMSCKIMGYNKPKYTLGMGEQDFVQMNKPVKKVLAEDRGVTIYRTNNGFQSMYAFFAFENGKLIRYEEGVNVDDYKFMRL